MTDPAFLALGDIHLDQLIWRKHQQVTGDAELGFTSFIDLCIDQYLPAVLVGDIFDTVKPVPAMLRLFRRQMDRCQSENIPVYAIQGNHDKQQIPWYVAAHDHVQHIGDGLQVYINGVSCVGFDYSLRDTIQQQLVELGTRKELPDCLLLHQACKQALKFEGQWNCDLEWVPEGIPLVVMGDIHTPWEANIREGQRAYYTGPAHARDMSQNGPKTCLQVNRDLTVSRPPISYRDIERFKCSASYDTNRAEEWIKEALDREHQLPPLVWFRFTPSAAGEVARIISEYSNVQFIREPVAEPAELEIDLGIEESIPEGLSVEALLKTIIDDEKEPEAYGFVLDLLDDQNSLLDVIRSRNEKFMGVNNG